MSPTTDLDGSGNNNTCYLLQKLPAELRIAIYELVFSATDNDLEVDLLQATPPEKYLILTCRRIRHEASAMYRSAYQTYWRTTRFVMQLSYTGKSHYSRELNFHVIIEALNPIKDRDLHSINQLALTSRLEHPRGCEEDKFTLIDTRGGWFEDRDFGGKGTFGFIVTDDKLGDARNDILRRVTQKYTSPVDDESQMGRWFDRAPAVLLLRTQIALLLS